MYHNIPISYHRPYLMITYFSSRRHHIAGSSSPYLYPYIGYLSSRFLSRFFGIHGRVDQKNRPKSTFLHTL